MTAGENANFSLGVRKEEVV